MYLYLICTKVPVAYTTNYIQENFASDIKQERVASYRTILYLIIFTILNIKI